MTALLSLDDIACQIDGAAILKDASLSAGPGEFIGLVGPNGAGKSTLLRVAAGLQKPSAGSCRIDGAPANKLSAPERAQRLSWLPQAREVAWAMTAREIVALGRFAWGAAQRENAEDTAAVTQALQEAGAAGFADRLVHTLSGGELARVHLARLLAGRTPIILADEPVAALDPAHQISVMTLLRAKANEGRTVIAALHELPLAARYCTRLVVLNTGSIVADGVPQDVLTHALMRDVFGVNANVETRGGVFRLHLDPLSE
ncbi:ABC transporter ATP-binding protein [Hyphococcus sp.]|uniref:ABC transporter ATP-binding protein n=1 Tax=Hyphococcus sp. TaxID=2038636 RepID=UPI0035C69C76